MSCAKRALMPLSQANASMPIVGFGCWKVPRDACADVVEQVIRLGYRHLDCAADYGNEKEVGEGIRRAIAKGLVKRQDLFITSKLWNTFHAREHVRPALERTLSDLGLSYVDLYLIHFPLALRYVDPKVRYPPEWFFDPEAEEPKAILVDVPVRETWEAMEQLVRDGLARDIGLANFSSQGIRDVFSYAKIKPVMLQVELHPLLPQSQLVRYAQSLGMAVTAFSPLGHGESYFGNPVSTLNEPVIKEIAAKHKRSAAQIVLRWNVERGVAVIPKSMTESRIKDNLALFDFNLDQDDVKRINAIEKRHRFNDPGIFGQQAFNTFMPIFD